jgi:hypothetical protein
LNFANFDSAISATIMNGFDGNQHGGLALDQSTATCPPGWQPGMKNYAFRRYQERLRLWNRITTLQAIQVGPSITGRLKGRPYNIAMKLRHTDHLGQVLEGDEALAYTGPDGDPGLGIPAAVSGSNKLLSVLTAAYGQRAQHATSQSADDYFGLTRDQHSLHELLVEEEFRWDEAEATGVTMSATARTHLLLRRCGLPETVNESLLLKVDNDMSRFQDIMNLMFGLAANHSSHLHKSAAQEAYPVYTDADWQQAQDQWYAWLNIFDEDRYQGEDYDTFTGYEEDLDYAQDEVGWGWPAYPVECDHQG